MVPSTEHELHTLLSCRSVVVSSSHPAQLPSVSFFSLQDHSVVLTPVLASLQHPGEGFAVQGQPSCCTTWEKQDIAETAITASKEATTKFRVLFCSLGSIWLQVFHTHGTFMCLLCICSLKKNCFQQFMGLSYTALPLQKYWVRYRPSTELQILVGWEDIGLSSICTFIQEPKYIYYVLYIFF